MITIKCPFGFVTTGELAQFDYGNDLIRFLFKGNMELEIRNVSQAMIQTLMNLGLHKLANSEVNFTTGKIELKKSEKK